MSADRFGSDRFRRGDANVDRERRAAQAAEEEEEDDEKSPGWAVARRSGFERFAELKLNRWLLGIVD